MTIDGAGGHVFAGPYLAATLGPWTLDRDGDTATLTAAIVSAHAYWRTQPITRLGLTMAHRTWTWRDVPVSFQDHALSATCTGSPTVE